MAVLVTTMMRSWSVCFWWVYLRSNVENGMECDTDLVMPRPLCDRLIIIKLNSGCYMMYWMIEALVAECERCRTPHHCPMYPIPVAQALLSIQRRPLKVLIKPVVTARAFSRKTQYFSSYKRQWRFKNKQRCKRSSHNCWYKLLDTAMLVLVVLSWLTIVEHGTSTLDVMTTRAFDRWDYFMIQVTRPSPTLSEKVEIRRTLFYTQLCCRKDGELQKSWSSTLLSNFFLR